MISTEDIESLRDRLRALAGSNWRAIYKRRLEIHKKRYQAHGNPLDAWEAILWSYVIDEPPPPWCMDYFVGGAVGLQRLADESRDGQTPNPADIPSTLDFVSKGAGTAFPKLGEWNWLALAMNVREAIVSGDKKYIAIENGVP